MPDLSRKITRPYRRRKYLIDRSFQLRFLFLFLGGVLVIGGLSGGITYFILHSILTQWLYSPHFYQQSSGELFGPALLWINTGLSIGLVLLAAVSSALFLRRVDGSLFRLTSHLCDISRGKAASVINFRRNDPLHEAAEEFNSMVKVMAQKRTVIFEQLSEANGLLNEILEQHLQDPEQVREILDRAAAKIKAVSMDLEGSEL
ncbi:MAG: hypothetical protein AVO38_13715 [delta proteobacterium ML8_D]|jgi:methyl-accepting chemotaxis protein|nr:MAG: hypothetical protein AVO34_10215 [Firmicutes bacterium ML8_F2]OPL13280.1 MAG: hypothetical protein AVO38_13715 [delta proteobacterium ML8_D]